VNRTILIFFLAFVVLIAVASLALPTALWGASSWRSVSPTSAAVLAAILMLLIVGRLRNPLTKVIEIPGRFSRKGAIATLSAGLVLLWLLRSRHFLWGDGYSTAIAIDSGITMLPAAPLATALSLGFFELLNRLLFWNSFDTSALLSVISGLLFVLAIRASIDRLDPDWRELEESSTEEAAENGMRSYKGRFPAMLTVLAGGYFAVFFGAGGSSSIAAMGMALFMLLSIVRLRGSALPLVVPALAALAAIMLHVSNIFLFPPLLYLLLSASRQRDSRREAAAAVGTVALCWIAAEFVASRIAGVPGIASQMASAASRALSSLSDSGSAETLSLAFNTLLITGPGALLAIILALSGGRERQGRIIRFLLVTAASAAVFIFISAPRMRGGLRWDLAVPAAAAMSLYATAELGRRASSVREFNESASLLTALGIFHLIPIVAVGFSLQSGESRILGMPLPAGRAETLIGAQVWHERDYGKAAEWWSTAAEKDPGNGDIWHRLGTAEMKLEDPLDAITFFHRAVKLDPQNTVYRTALAEAYIEHRWFAEASAEFELLVSEYPDSARLWTRLGFARNHGNMYTGAIEAYRRALELDPENMEYVRNLTSAILNRGAELQNEGDFDGAREMYWQARRLYPGDWISLNNLATLEMELKEWDKARKLLDTALKENVGISQLHFNMSVVLEELGIFDEALEHLRTAASFNPMEPPSAEHFERLMRKSGEID
jgi:tetratricopeptide (TPR) repeat protein